MLSLHGAATVKAQLSYEKTKNWNNGAVTLATQPSTLLSPLQLSS